MTHHDIHLTTQVFDTPEAAEQAYQEAIEAGYKPQDINVLMSQQSRDKYYNSVLVKEGSKASEGLAVGGATGAALGGIVAALAAVGTNLLIPGLGLVVAGPIAAGLAGAGAGGITGGLMGSLIGWGISEDKAKVIESSVQSGGIALGVKENLPNSDLSTRWEKYRTH